MNTNDKHVENTPEVVSVVLNESITNVSEPKSNNNVFIIAGAIIIAGALIAAGIFFSRGNDGSNKGVNIDPPLSDNLRPVSKTDHIRGNLSAAIKIVEFSDPECPWCKRFHPTLKQIFDEYGPSNKVAWVYRHFPVPNLHPKAPYESEAIECAGSVGGPDKFWQYLDRIFEVTPADNGLDPAELPKIAAYVGVDVDQFNSCLASGKSKSVVDADIEDGIKSGVNGTPSTFFIDRHGEIHPLPGARSYEQVKQAVEILLAK